MTRTIILICIFSIADLKAMESSFFTRQEFEQLVASRNEHALKQRCEQEKMRLKATMGQGLYNVVRRVCIQYNCVIFNQLCFAESCNDRLKVSLVRAKGMPLNLIVSPDRSFTLYINGQAVTLNSAQFVSIVKPDDSKY